MKKRYLLTLEFEAEIIEKVSPNLRIKKNDIYLNKLFKVLLKNDQSILEIYRNLIMSDLGNDNHIYEIDKNIRTLKVRDDIEVLIPVIELLPANEKNHFHEILASEDKTADDFYDFLYAQFDVLKVKDAKFTEKNI